MRSILTVTTAGTQEITTLETVKTALKITATTEDDLIALWIRQATAAIGGYCNRVFIEETVSEVFRSYGGFQVDRRGGEQPLSRALALARYPVSSIASITIDGTALTDADYELEPDTGLVNRLVNDIPVSWYGLKTTVAYTGGYAIADIPPDVERAAIMQIAAYRSAVDRDPAIKMERMLQRTYEYEVFAPASLLLPEVVALIADYTDSRFG